MKIGVVVFPGSNCDHDAWYAVSQNLGHQAEFIWHDSDPARRCRCRHPPRRLLLRRLPALRRDRAILAGHAGGEEVRRGRRTCAGHLQRIPDPLSKAGLLPGALLRNAGLKFICKPVELTVETTNSPFTHAAKKGQVLRFPIAHGEGNYFADDRTLDELEAEDRDRFPVRDALQRLASATSPGF